MFSAQRETNFFDFIGIHVNFVQDFFTWWFVEIPTHILRLIRRVNTAIIDSTSLLIIIKGYFKPWKNDYNIAGWLVGMVLKTLYIPVILIILAIANSIMFGLFFMQLALLPLLIAMLVINPFLPI